MKELKLTKEQEAQIKKEVDDERNREFMYSAKEERYFAWKDDNFVSLLKEFAELNEDEFDNYCKNQYKNSD